jgi:hypothetical protein
MSKTGAPRKAAFNLNKLRAQQADARGEKHLEFEITPEGSEEPVAFTVLRKPWWPVKFLVALKELDGDVDILRELLGEADFKRLTETGFNVGDMKALFDEIMGRDEDDADEDEAGISLGESSGSSES